MVASVPELIKRFVDGDQTAFAELIRRFRDKIYKISDSG